MDHSLNPRQIVFVSEYLTTGNATHAYKKAYGIENDNVAAVNAHNLLRNPKIQAYIEKFKSTIMEKAEVTIERTVAEIARIAFADIGQVYKAKKVSELPEDIRRAISEVQVTDTKQGKRRTIKLHNKLVALDQLMKHLGGYVTVQDIINKLDETTANVLLSELQKRLESNEEES